MEDNTDKLILADRLALLVELREQLLNPLYMNNELLEIVDEQLIKLLK